MKLVSTCSFRHGCWHYRAYRHLVLLVSLVTAFVMSRLSRTAKAMQKNHTLGVTRTVAPDARPRRPNLMSDTVLKLKICRSRFPLPPVFCARSEASHSMSRAKRFAL